jgi:2-dehydro-3-deoxy-D-arabinonate dehydratase
MQTIKVYRTEQQVLVQTESNWYSLKSFSWDELFVLQNPHESLVQALEGRGKLRLDPAAAPDEEKALVPLDNQEIWAAGVTYYRSRDARMAESEKAGGGSFYDRVYEAERPELFYKGSSRTAVGPGSSVRIREDSRWNVPEPELTLAVNSRGGVFGFTVGNDMSSRDIEGENPLYLPQAKVYDGSAALGPCLLLAEDLPKETEIRLRIVRSGTEAFSGVTAIREIKRSFTTLVEFLYRDNSFPHGCYLMTGTGIVPPDTFSLQHGDVIHITIQPVGTLTNTVE